MGILDGIFRHAARVPRKLGVGGVPYDIDGQTIYGLEANRPTPADAHSALPFAYYVCVDTNERYQTDGSNWVHRRPVGVVRRAVIPRTANLVSGRTALGPLSGFSAWELFVRNATGIDVSVGFYASSSTALRVALSNGSVSTYTSAPAVHVVRNAGSYAGSYMPLSAFPLVGTVKPNPYLDYFADTLYVSVWPDGSPSGDFGLELVGHP